MKLKLISFKLCPFVHRATILLHEKNIEYDIEYIDLNNKPDWFLNISPLGKVPVLVVDEQPLFESLAILEYLDESNQPSLHPEDLILKARNRAYTGIVDGLFMSSYKLSIAKNEVDYETAITAFQNGFRLLENEIKGPYFNGQTFSFLDIVMAPVLFRLSFLEKFIGNLYKNFPKFEKLTNELSKHPSVTKSVVSDFEEIYLGYLKSNEALLLQKSA